VRIALYHNVGSGGTKRAIYEWVKQLAGNHSIDIYSLSTANHAFCDIRPFGRKNHIYQFKPRKLFNSPFGRINQLQRWRDLGDLDRLNEQIAADISAGQYDVVFANTCIFSSIPPLLKYLRIPSVFYLHEPFRRTIVRNIQRPYFQESTWQIRFNRYDPFIKLYQHRLDMLQSKCAIGTSRLLACSQFLQKRIFADMGIEAQVCAHGVDLNGFQSTSSMWKQNYVVSVGEMTPRKGFDFIIESLSRIPPSIRPPLKIACNYKDLNELEFVQKLAGRRDVEMEVLTNLGTEELKLLYSQSAMCVYAPVLEPFGLVPLEAMSCATPVVAVREGGVQESVVHEYTGLLVRRDPDEFAAGVQKLIHNPGLALEYGSNGRDHVVKNWSWDRAVANLERHLSAVIKQGKQPDRIKSFCTVTKL